MKTLYTIGYTRKTLRDFVGLLREAGVDCVIDIRLNNTSQLAAFSKKEDLDFILKEGFSIHYVHMVELAPSADMLEVYKANRNWPNYESRYRRLITERDMVTKLMQAIIAKGWQKPCLLCSEPEADQCHRRLLAEAVRQRVGTLEVRHL